MQHAARVREPNGVTNAEKNSQAVRKGRDRLNIFVEPISLHKFHGVENAAVRQCTHVVNGHDAGMLESRQHARFADQPVCQVAVRSRNIEDFQRHAPLQFPVFRGIHHSHAAARQAFEQAVARAGEVRRLRAVAQSFQRLVGKKFHFASHPKAARASR